jgi:hypothetical protein
MAQHVLDAGDTIVDACKIAQEAVVQYELFLRRVDRDDGDGFELKPQPHHVLAREVLVSCSPALRTSKQSRRTSLTRPALCSGCI